MSRCCCTSSQAQSAESAFSAHRDGDRRALAAIENVVQTFGRPVLKIKHFHPPNPRNCESWVSHHFRELSRLDTKSLSFFGMTNPDERSEKCWEKGLNAVHQSRETGQ